MKAVDLIDKLYHEEALSGNEWWHLLTGYNVKDYQYARKMAGVVTEKFWNNVVYVRGLIEFSNYCKNDCYYCGLRCSNQKIERYRLTYADILQCCQTGYEAGIRSFVLQSGEDSYYTDNLMADIIQKIHQEFAQCTIALSIGEKETASYRLFYESGASRYLLREETADPSHYYSLHPASMSFQNRIDCLYKLKDIGYNTGCGFMVGTPGQRTEHLMKDLMFIQEFHPGMIGIGPFIPQKDTPFGNQSKGNTEFTLYLISLLRILNKTAFIPSTTALESVSENGKILGISAGANVIMLNISPTQVRDKYAIYDNKSYSLEKTIDVVKQLSKELNCIGRVLDVDL